jgi:hypothetical protein
MCWTRYWSPEVTEARDCFDGSFGPHPIQTDIDPIDLFRPSRNQCMRTRPLTSNNTDQNGVFRGRPPLNRSPMGPGVICVTMSEHSEQEYP